MKILANDGISVSGIAMLEKEGFEVSIWESPMDKVMKLPEEERMKAMMKARRALKS